MDFTVRPIETPSEKSQLTHLFYQGRVGGGYDLTYDLELGAFNGREVLGGVQVKKSEKGAFIQQPCPTYIIKNIGLAPRFWQANSGLGSALIQKIKNEAQSNNIRAVALTSSRASELASRNDFDMIYAPDNWIYCIDSECVYDACAMKKSFVTRQNLIGLDAEKTFEMMKTSPSLKKYLIESGNGWELVFSLFSRQD